MVDSYFEKKVTALIRAEVCLWSSALGVLRKKGAAVPHKGLYPSHLLLLQCFCHITAQVFILSLILHILLWFWHGWFQHPFALCVPAVVSYFYLFLEASYFFVPCCPQSWEVSKRMVSLTSISKMSKRMAFLAFMVKIPLPWCLQDNLPLLRWLLRG